MSKLVIFSTPEHFKTSYGHSSTRSIDLRGCQGLLRDPQNKLVHIGLTYIYGVGDKFSKQICKSLDIPREKRVNELTDDEILKIREYIDQNFKVEGDLRRDYSLSIKRLIDLACYRGTRHRKKLPVRGQRTRCNARTRKGKAIAIAGKKLTPLKK